MIAATSEIGGTMLRATGVQAAPSAALGSVAAGNSAGSDFSTVFKQLASEAVDVLKTGEAAAIQGIHGQIGTQAVVEAVMAAEHTLQAAVAVRDKVVSAYLELSRMTI